VVRRASRTGVNPSSASRSPADAIETEAAAQAAAFHRNEFSDTIDAWRLSRTVD
jgi:hypothetical protein